MAKHNGRTDLWPVYDSYTGVHGSERENRSERRAGMSDNSGEKPTANIYNPYYTGKPQGLCGGSRNPSIDRQEIIRKIKSRESRPTSPDRERPSSRTLLKQRQLPALRWNDHSFEARPSTPVAEGDNETIGLQIERPRSAFHRGDFRDVDKAETRSAFERFGESLDFKPAPSLSTSPVAPWHQTFPPAALRHGSLAQTSPTRAILQNPRRNRATSNNSLTPNFVYRPPTSPLVQASRPDTPEPTTKQRSGSPDKSRRHTFSPPSFQRFSSASDYPNLALGPDPICPPKLRPERSFPYQAHQPRRSLHSFASEPQTPVPRARRPSLADSPLHHATLVGSYEESILRGRMSTTPSKPLNFVAQIGVLGKSQCRPSLQCPPHATVPFPAVFYSYGSSAKAISTADQPSPYVGLVDLEHNLSPPEPSSVKRRRRTRTALSDQESRNNSCSRSENNNSDSQTRLRRRQKKERRSQSPKAPPGGSYRIPQQGQLQIVIKNPNKTAVKLFLIPYDLSDMEPGQKTFIRQRSYSAGPIIDMPISARTNLGTDRPEASLSTSDDPDDRPTLRYLIHLHICCPSKGRYFLYKSIRVVFANRVPDGKEKLRSEIQLPEPKYSVYKHGRDSNAGLGGGHTVPESRGASNAAVTGSRRHEDGQRQPRRFLAQSLPAADYTSQYNVPTQAMPSYISMLPSLESRPVSRQTNEGIDLNSDLSQETRPPYSPLSPTSSDVVDTTTAEVKLGYSFDFERDRSLERYPEPKAEGLLSRRLKEVALQARKDGEEQA